MQGNEPARPGSKAERRDEALRAFALGLPGAYEEFPWGERAVKVKKKVFLFMSRCAAVTSFSVKLPQSGREALLLPETQPTGYGLGKSGWVSGRYGEGDAMPLPLIRAWIEESYRAVAPKKLLAELAERAECDGAEVSARAKKARRKKA